MASTPDQARIEGHVYVGRPWLAILRAAWVVAMLAALAIYVLSVPGYVPEYIQGAPAIMPYLPPIAARVIGAVLGGLSLLMVLLSLVVSGLLFWRRPEHVMSLVLSVFLIAYGITFGGLVSYLAYLLPEARELSQFLIAPVMGPIVALMFALFPNGRFVPRWSKWLVALALLLAVMEAARYTLPLPAGWSVLQQVGYSILGASMLGIQIYRYLRVSTPTERQQTKWVVYGFGLFVLTQNLLTIPYMFGYENPTGAGAEPPWSILVGLTWTLSTFILPAAFTIALLRHRLFDIDRLIRRTLVYSGATALLASVYFGTVVLLQQTLEAITGQRSQLAVVVSTLVIAALFNPLRKRLQQFVDRAFYRKSYDAEQTLARFGEAVQNEVDIADVEAALLQAVNDTLQPTSVGLWLPGAES